MSLALQVLFVEGGIGLIAFRLYRPPHPNDARLTVGVTIGLLSQMWICDLILVYIPFQTTHVKHGVRLHIRGKVSL